MASFGWSTGDIVATISLVGRLIKCIHGSHGATEHFQELVSELQGLSRALSEIAELTRVPGQSPEIHALKFASCACAETLQRFYEKIEPFQDSLGVGSSQSKLKSVPRMVRWELLVKKDVPELRSYIVAHVGSLNLRLSAALLKGSSETQSALVRTDQKQTHMQEELTTNYEEMIRQIGQIPTVDTTPKLDVLLSIALRVWRSQNEILSHLGTASAVLPPPDLEHTWAQAPVKFEDALGRRFVVPSEYDWDKLEVIIHAQFRVGPGSGKVRSGDYELFHRSTGESISATNFTGLIPGSFVAMAIIVGQYRTQEFVGSCTRLSCRSSRVRKVNSKLIVCMECQSMFKISSKLLPLPMKPMLSETIARSTPFGNDIDSTKTAIMDRRHYKNVSICFVELPATPSVFREKYHRDYQPPVQNSIEARSPNGPPGIPNYSSQIRQSGSVRRMIGIASKLNGETDTRAESSSIRNSYGVRSTLQRRLSRTPLGRLNFHTSAKERNIEPQPPRTISIQKRRASWIESEVSPKISMHIATENVKEFERRNLSEFTDDELIAEIRRRECTYEPKIKQEARPTRFTESFLDPEVAASEEIPINFLIEQPDDFTCPTCSGLTWTVVGDFMEACKNCQTVSPVAKVRLDGILDENRTPTPTNKSLPALMRNNLHWKSEFSNMSPRPPPRHGNGGRSSLICVCGFQATIGDEGLRAECFNRRYIRPLQRKKTRGPNVKVEARAKKVI